MNAKLNLFLRVVRRRPDGYHDLESIFHGVDLADDLTFEPATTGVIDIAMHLAPGLEGDLPASADNLVSDVARRLTQPGAVHPGVRITIRKWIPLGSGLGGGSADAAGALIALNDLWGLELGREELAEKAGRLGSDVPYFLSGGTALVMDRGGDLTPLPARRPLHFVLGISFEPLSTRSVYAGWDEVGSSTGSSSAAMALALGAGDVREVAALLHNDLEGPASKLRPDLPERKAALLSAGALGVGMSGSGPTMFAVTEDREQAQEIALKVAGDFDRVETVTSAAAGVERLA